MFRLRRYNGKHGEHTNRIEGDRISGFHIHTASERYQDLGASEDAYAEVATSYGSLREAIARMLAECGFEIEKGAQMTLFGGMLQ